MSGLKLTSSCLRPVNMGVCAFSLNNNEHFVKKKFFFDELYSWNKSKEVKHHGTVITFQTVFSSNTGLVITNKPAYAVGTQFRILSTLTCDGVGSDVWADGPLNWGLPIGWDSIDLEASDCLSLCSPANSDGGLCSIRHTGPSWSTDICVGSQLEVNACYFKTLPHYTNTCTNE